MPARTIPKPPCSARFYAQLPQLPTDAADVPATMGYYAALLEARESDVTRRRANPTDPECLNDSEASNLRRLISRWRKRAAGIDRRWNLAGGRSGRLTVALEQRLHPPADPAWTAPLDKGK